MRIWPVCIPCIYDARAREILESSLKPDEKIYALTYLHRFLSTASIHASTIGLASEAFRQVKGLIRNPDPYRDYKDRSNKYVEEKILPLVKENLRGTEGYERFRKLVIAAININVLDPGVPGYGELDVFLNDNLGLDQTAIAYRLLEEAENIVYILDNAGEALIDLLFVEELARRNKEITVIAKSMPYQNDVTVDEAIELGFPRFARVLGTGSDSGGLLPGEFTDTVLKALKECDVAIAKGMAAYESMVEWSVPCRVIHIFMAKCMPVATSVGVKVREGVVMVRSPEVER